MIDDWLALCGTPMSPFSGNTGRKCGKNLNAGGLEGVVGCAVFQTQYHHTHELTGTVFSCTRSSQQNQNTTLYPGALIVLSGEEGGEYEDGKGHIVVEWEGTIGMDKLMIHCVHVWPFKE